MADRLAQSRLINEQILNLPHTKDGHIDYKTLGNMITANLLGEAFHGSCVDYHNSSPEHVCRQESGGWQYYYKEDDVVVLRKRLPNKYCCFMGRGVIEVPLDQVAVYLHKFQNRLEWDYTVKQVEICQQYSENDWLIYMANEDKRCFFTSYRDFLYYCRTAYIDNKYVQSSLSIEDKDYPHRPPYIRAMIKQGTGWVVEKYNNSECSSLITYVAQIDLKDLPPVIVNRVLRRQPLAIKHIRQRLTLQKVPLSIGFGSPPPQTFESSQLPERSSFDDYYEESAPMSDFIPLPLEENLITTDLYPWIAEREEKKRAATIGSCSSSSQANGRANDTLEMSLPNSLYYSTKNSDDDSNGKVSSSVASNKSDSMKCKPRCFSTSLPDSVDVLSPVQLREERGSTSSVDQITQQANNSAQKFPGFSSWNTSNN